MTVGSDTPTIQSDREPSQTQSIDSGESSILISTVTAPEAHMTSEQEREQQKYYDERLIAYEEDPSREVHILKAVNIFLDSSRTMQFKYYRGKYVERARALLVNVDTALLRVKQELEMWSEGADESEIFSSSEPFERKTFVIFQEAIKRKHGLRPALATVAGTIRGWQIEVSEGIESLIELTLPRYELGNSSYRAGVLNVIHSAHQCRDDVYVEKFVEIVESLEILLRKKSKNRDDPQQFIPSIFLCGPSGSGKSVFCTNLGSCPIPSLYWLNSVKAQMQNNYIPFQSFSTVMIDAFKKDFEKFKNDMCDGLVTEETLGALWLSLHAKNFNFQSVHLLVHLFKKMFEIRESHHRNGEQSSWLQAQFEIEDFPKGLMTPDEGTTELDAVRKRQYAFTKHPAPLMAIIDEFSLLEADGVAHPSPYSRDLYHFTRSLLRVVGIVPVITGTDARASNFCTHSNHSRGSEELWFIIFNDFPGFSLPKFDMLRLSIEERFKHSPAKAMVTRVLDFLNSIRLYDNPLFIQLAFDHLERIDADKEQTFVELLGGILCRISTFYITRKRFVHFFNVGQQAYTLCHRWADGILSKHIANAACVNGHIAHLYARPDVPGLPYSSLKVNNGIQSYAKADGDQIFNPLSYFSSFHEAPLSGLALFGLDLAKSYAVDGRDLRHLPFVASLGGKKRITCLDAMLSEYPFSAVLNSNDTITNSSTGTPLEQLFHMASIVASRENGVNGCKLKVFLRSFIRELNSNSVMYANVDNMDENPVSVYHDFPYDFSEIGITGADGLDDIIVPLLAPMPVPEWPRSVVDLLDGCGDGPLHLGAFEPSFGYNDCVGSIIYETNLPIDLPQPKSDDDDPIEEVPAEYEAAGSGEDEQPKEPASKKHKHTKIIQPSALGEKIYGISSIHSPCPLTAGRRISIVGECKLYKDNLTLSLLRQSIVQPKFHRNRFGDCKTFMVLALNANNFNGGAKESEHLKWMNRNGYFIFALKRSESSFTFEPVPCQPPHTMQFKNVFVIGLTTVWRDPGILDKVKEKWANFIDKVPAK